MPVIIQANGRLQGTRVNPLPIYTHISGYPEIYIYIYVCICICSYLCMCLYARMSIYVCIHRVNPTIPAQLQLVKGKPLMLTLRVNPINIYTYICVYVCVYIYVCVYNYACLYIYIHRVNPTITAELQLGEG